MPFLLCFAMETDIHTGLNSAIVTAQGMKLDAYVCLARSEYGCTGLIHPKGALFNLGWKKIVSNWSGPARTERITLPYLFFG